MDFLRGLFYYINTHQEMEFLRNLFDSMNMYQVMDFLRGLFDSVNIYQVIYIFMNDKHIRNKYIKMVSSLLVFYILNFVNFYINKLYSNYFYLYFVLFLTWNLLIYIPLYLLTFFLAVNVTNTINKRFIDVYLQEKKQKIKAISKISTEIHIGIIFLVYILIINLIFFLPHIGKYLFFILTIFQYTYYCVDYVLNYHNIYHLKKISIISNNLTYFLGYGFIIGLLLINSNFILAHVLTNTLIPLYIIRSYFIMNKILDKNTEIIERSNYNMFSIFAIPYYLTNIIISHIFKKDENK
jgi:hypothetical protein